MVRARILKIDSKAADAPTANDANGLQSRVSNGGPPHRVP